MHTARWHSKHSKHSKLPANLSLLELLVNGKSVDALARLVPAGGVVCTPHPSNTSAVKGKGKGKLHIVVSRWVAD